MSKSAGTYATTLRSFFGCLITALSFLHEHLVKHKSSNLSNILVHEINVLLADFGTWIDVADSRPTTTSLISSSALRYYALETAWWIPSGRATEVWSLSSVFLEIAVTLSVRNIYDLEQYSTEPRAFAGAPRIPKQSVTDNISLDQLDASYRHKSDPMKIIFKDCEGVVMFCGDCCAYQNSTSVVGTHATCYMCGETENPGRECETTKPLLVICLVCGGGDNNSADLIVCRTKASALTYRNFPAERGANSKRHTQATHLGIPWETRKDIQSVNIINDDLRAAPNPEKRAQSIDEAH